MKKLMLMGLLVLTAAFPENAVSANLDFGPVVSVNVRRENPESLKGLNYSYGIAFSGEQWTLSMIGSAGRTEVLGNTVDREVFTVFGSGLYLFTFPVDIKTEKKYEVREVLLKNYQKIGDGEGEDETVSLGFGLGLVQVQTTTRTTYRYQPDDSDYPGLMTIVNPRYRNSTSFASTEIPIGSVGLRLKSPLPNDKATLVAEIQQTFRLGSKKDVGIDPVGMSMVARIGIPFN